MSLKNPSLVQIQEAITRYLKEIHSLKKSLLDSQVSLNKSIKVYQILKQDRQRIDLERGNLEKKNNEMRQTLNGLIKSEGDLKSEHNILLFENDKLRKKSLELETKLKDAEQQLTNSVNTHQHQLELDALHNQNVMVKNANLHLVEELNNLKKENKKLSDTIKELVGENYISE